MCPVRACEAPDLLPSSTLEMIITNTLVRKASLFPEHRTV